MKFLSLLSLIICASTAFAQTAAQPAVLRLADLEEIAMQKNPTLAQAAADIRVAQGRSLQAGLYPNPFVGVANEDLSFGPVIRGGEWGVFVEQTIVLGRKLGLSRRAAEQELVRAEAQAEAQRLRVMNDIRTLFYRAAVAQRNVDVRTRLLALVREAVAVSRQLQNVGQADVPDVLEIEIEEQTADLAVISARIELAEAWAQLAAAAGDMGLEVRPLQGDVEEIPPIDTQLAMTTLLRESPEMKVARSGISKAEFNLDRARAEPIPNLELLAGVHYNRERLESGGRPIGIQGSFAIGVRVPLFDRNQGNIDIATAELDRARREVDRLALSLQSRMAVSLRRYEETRIIAQKYRDQVIPTARRAYDMYLAGFRRMAAAYPQALIAQRTLLQLQDEYNKALSDLWARVVEIQGLLLEGGLIAP